MTAELPFGAPQAPPAGPPVLEVAGLSVRLGRRPVLSGVSLQLQEGEVMGLIGANGAGKTTLLRTILGLQVPEAGDVVLRTNSRGKKGVGYVPQKINLSADLPLRTRDLVALGADGHRLGPGWPGNKRWRLADDLLDAVGAGHLAQARVGALSGGEQQRALIAHAMAGQPSLVLLDEPLANLDLRAAREVVLLLGRLASAQGVAVLVSTHDINPLLPVMDRLVYLANGRSVTGTPQEVVRGDVLTRLYGHHVDVLRAHGRVIVSVGDDGPDDPVWDGSGSDL
ncbi:MAG TPA: metal ABC transporter ATP-binding protein [Acidimicrobiales bacterium]|nr:metal ABC transporter ATP-binding protein [Acidimicrobiales bacterium]